MTGVIQAFSPARISLDDCKADAVTRNSKATERLGPGDAAHAGAVLRAGGLVAFPTETVYGLGGDATNPQAVAAIYAAKDRPRFNPLISHVADSAAARRIGVFDRRAELLADRFWPGPLTLVVPAAADCPVCDLARAGLDTVALRVPAHPLAHALLEAAGCPVAAPSANRSGRVSPTTAEHVLGDLDGRISAVLDGGPTRVGIESTIVACLADGVRLLRPGGVPKEDIEQALGEPVVIEAHDGDAPLAPGMLASHYAPDARVRLNATEVRAGEAWLGFGPLTPGGAPPVASENLSASGDLAEAAAHLFAALRHLDAARPDGIAVAPVPGHGLGEAINDRLQRAAAPR